MTTARRKNYQNRELLDIAISPDGSVQKQDYYFCIIDFSSVYFDSSARV